jgi:DNA invertase Pin-like site-specific DNA recombinase
LIEIVENLKSKGVGFRSIIGAVDTTTASGKLFFHMIGALAEIERNLISERIRAGLAAARMRGRLGGRPRKLPPKQIKLARSLLKNRETTVTEFAEHLGVSRSTLYRALA